jgi:hypothetical protein
MTSKNKKNRGNKVDAAMPATASLKQEASTAVVVDMRTRRKYVPRRGVSPAAEGLRLVQAFLKIQDPIKRAELIKLAEEYVQRAQR